MYFLKQVVYPKSRGRVSFFVFRHCRFLARYGSASRKYGTVTFRISVHVYWQCSRMRTRRPVPYCRIFVTCLLSLLKPSISAVSLVKAPELKYGAELPPSGGAALQTVALWKHLQRRLVPRSPRSFLICVQHTVGAPVAAFMRWTNL